MDTRPEIAAQAVALLQAGHIQRNMCTSMPVLLEGSNLGERLRHLNCSVAAAFEQNIELSKILEAKESFPIDRIYKIDLASRHRDVDYILHNLKDDDMLYVSRALKSHWLLEPQYRDVINPRHLEEEIFPRMIQPAVNKTRHWVQLNLTDATRCQEFYEYYKGRHEIAIKFLWHCSLEYILAETSNILDKLTPRDLKILCETCPQAAKVFLEGLSTNKEALSRYLENETTYFQSLQCVLKVNAPLYLDILEKYFNVSKFEPLSQAATRYIMKNHKDRFHAKPELYTSYILHLKTLANFVTSEEAKNFVLQLAKADYLGSRFSYKKIEPLIKRVSVDERAAFKKQIFVDKAIGDKIMDWPYPPPINFEKNTTGNRNIFLDKEHEPWEYEFRECGSVRRMLMKRKYSKWATDVRKSPLDILFDRYRFKAFGTTFQELSKKLLMESTIEGRMNILLVLVSKSGGVPGQVKKLLKLLIEKHINEPCNIRAAVVRSLVKRTCAWRLSDELWAMLLEFGRDLGLEGQHSELACLEGLHAVVLRHLINDVPLSVTLRTAFLNEISTLKEYKLNSEEIMLVGPRLAKILLDSKPNTFLDVIAEYKLKINEIPDAEMTLVQMARNDSDLARRLFDCKIGRRYLLKETFGLIDNNVSFMNALKHDTSVLENGKSFASLVNDKRTCHDRFLQSLALYFNEPNGLADQHKASLIEAMKANPRPWFARTVNILFTNVSLLDLLKRLPDMEIKDTSISQLAAAFRATAHKCRPMLDIASVDWCWLGAKAIANRVLVCREIDRDSNINLLLQFRRTARIAIRLGLTTRSSAETFIIASKLRPAVALKMACKVYLKNNTIDPLVWEVIKNLIENLVTEKTKLSLLNQLKDNNNIPDNIKSEYWQVIYNVFLKIDKRKATPILCRLENLLPHVDNTIITNIIERFVGEELTFNPFLEYKDRENQDLFIRIMVKHLLACRSESEQNERLEKICDPFFDKIEVLGESICEDKRSVLYLCVRKFIRALKCNKVFLKDYVSGLPVFERVLQRMKKLLPIEKYFTMYVEMHLIMLYYKALKLSMNKKQSVFENIDQNLEEAIETVGLQLGQNIGDEVKELTAEYYFSIIDIYKYVLESFLHDFEYEGSCNPIVVPLLKGLFDIKGTEGLILAQHILCAGEYPSQHRDETLAVLKGFNNKVINMFLCDNMN